MRRLLQALPALLLTAALAPALEAVAVGLLEDHLRHCVVDAAKLGGAEADAKITEASQAIARLVRHHFGLPDFTY
mgnify:CR=1 FL=1